MSGKDETDLVRNKELTAENPATQSQKSNLDHSHDLSNGDTSNAVNGDSSTNLDENSKQTTVQSTVTKSNTPSNWVQFEAEDGSDKVHKHLILIIEIHFLV